MIVRAFNAAGIERCREALQSLRSGALTAIPQPFLEDSQRTEVIADRSISRPPSMANRWELGIWLWRTLDGLVPDETLLGSEGFWTWTAFWLLDIIAPSANGTRKLGEDARIILDRSNKRRWYRHLLAGPYLLVRAHEDNPSRLRAMLAGAPDTPGELYEQLAGRKEIVTSAAVVEVFSQLYWKPNGSSFKRGAAGRGPGSANRYGKLLEQFDLTYDLGATPAGKLLSMLPSEFDRFKQ